MAFLPRARDGASCGSISCFSAAMVPLTDLGSRRVLLSNRCVDREFPAVLEKRPQQLCSPVERYLSSSLTSMTGPAHVSPLTTLCFHCLLVRPVGQQLC